MVGGSGKESHAVYDASDDRRPDTLADSCHSNAASPSRGARLAQPHHSTLGKRCAMRNVIGHYPCTSIIARARAKSVRIAMADSLTELELVALNAELNLSDAHTHQSPSELEWERIHARLPELFRESQRTPQGEIERAAFDELLRAGGQHTAAETGWFISTYAASVSTDIVAWCMSRRHNSGILVEPTFDNISALLLKHGLWLQPVALDESSSDIDTATVIRTVENSTPPAQFVFLVAPNNPTGHILTADGLQELCVFAASRDLTIVIDACFRLYDPRQCFDIYGILERSKCSYIVIEDSGKLWPTEDLKTSFVVASADWRSALEHARNNVLLNVSPIANLVVREYSRLHVENPDLLRGLVRWNRKLVRAAIGQSDLFKLASEHSMISVEFLRTGSVPAQVLVSTLKQAGLAMLPGELFYWSRNDAGAFHIRLALARDSHVIERSMSMLMKAVENFS